MVWRTHRINARQAAHCVKTPPGVVMHKFIVYYGASEMSADMKHFESTLDGRKIQEIAFWCFRSELCPYGGLGAYRAGLKYLKYPSWKK